MVKITVWPLQQKVRFTPGENNNTTSAAMVLKALLTWKNLKKSNSFQKDKSSKLLADNFTVPQLQFKMRSSLGEVEGMEDWVMVKLTRRASLRSLIFIIKQTTY